jgi:membrane fusion protein
MNTKVKGNRLSSLFRKEAMDAQSQRLTGTISLAQPLSIKITVGIIVIMVAAVLLYLLTSNYTRKETIRGYLKPAKGLTKVYANRQGTIDKIYVKAGDKVAKGQPIIRIKSQQSLPSGKELSQQLIDELTNQLNLLKDELNQYSTLEIQELTRLEQRLASLQKTKRSQLKQQQLLTEKLSLSNQQQIQYSKLYQKGYLSVLEHQKQQERQLVVKQEKQTLEQQLLQQHEQQNALLFEQQNIPQQYHLKRRVILQRQSEIKRQLSQAKNNFSYVINASHSGTISTLLVHEGEHLAQTRPLLTLLPENTLLIAELLLPSRSAGFVKKGNESRLRFDAFPHQRFGFVNSKISHVDQSLISQGEVNLPIDVVEPVYRLQAQLQQQDIAGYGQKFPLKSGMLFEADIILESRSLMQWLLDPIYSLNGRLN